MVQDRASQTWLNAAQAGIELSSIHSKFTSGQYHIIVLIVYPELIRTIIMKAIGIIYAKL